MILFFSPRLLIALFMLCSLGSLAQSTPKTTRNQTTQPRLSGNRAAWQDGITIADTLRLATEYEPAKPKKTTTTFRLAAEADAPAPADSVTVEKVPVSPAPIIPTSLPFIYRHTIYNQSPPNQQQPVVYSVAGRTNAPVSRPTPDKAESDLERVLNRKKRVN